MEDFKVFLAALSALFLTFTQGQSKEMKLSFAVVYNNIAYDTNLTTAWGMSCHIEGIEKTILFDTGGDGSILLSNMEKMGIDPKTVDVVFLSHIHGDHVGGLWAFLERSNDVIVYLPQSFPEEFKRRVKKEGAEVVSVHDPVEICKNVHSTGELGTRIQEQSLIIDTARGLIIATGCAHPGVVNIVRTSRELLRKEVYLLSGGFHLASYSDSEVRETIQSLKQLGVERVGPSHCTGERAIELFRAAWGEKFLDLGCGATVEMDIEDCEDEGQ